MITDVQDVTGIKVNETGNNAVIKFTYTVERNIAGESLPPDSKLSNYLREPLSSNTREGSANLALYDDGWRVEALELLNVFASSRL